MCLILTNQIKSPDVETSGRQLKIKSMNRLYASTALYKLIICSGLLVSKHSQ
jgi:hypothetical protein